MRGWRGSGRTAAGQVLAAVGERLRGGGQTQATVAGQRLGAAAAAAEAQAAYERAWAERLQEGRLQEQPRALAVRDLVAGSSFNLAATADAGAAQAAAQPGGRWTVWGRGGWSHFAGRADGGAAESGAGLVLSGRLSYALPAWGLALSAGGEGLLVHEADGLREWGAGGALRFDPGAPGRGLALRVEPFWGVAGRGAVTPYAGVTLAADGARTWRVGGRVRLDSGLAVSLEGTRAEPVSAAAEHTLALGNNILG